MQVKKKKVALITAHPDDETLWAGGMLLNNPHWDCFIVCLCRRHDPDRAPKFNKALEILNCKGNMGDLDDGPDQTPQNQTQIDRLILELLPIAHYDLIITHNPLGEYTRHLRHEEIGISVLNLWHENKISCTELLVFAYQDNHKQHYPKAASSADFYFELSTALWQKKYAIITQIYGFAPESWEAKTTPQLEAYRRFTNKDDALEWLKKIKL
ncbi:PIG-L deacetylase family protein [Flavobacterium sp. UBA7680]|uniref:PIG-L deacetylase family protein n=1 Tax=Flavobacterium sp. UBA7680 TaxID=1946559 RepID=UPI0025C517C5|nr:PIG-L family deacetylase [Flavobacterium sp. UBA7680]